MDMRRNMACKYCLSEYTRPAGSMRGKKMIRCNDCGKRFIENDNLPTMRVNKHVILTALSMYFEGLSVRKVSRQLEQVFGEKVDQTTVWRWVLKYSKLVSEYTKTLSPHVGTQWHHDETVIRCEGQNQWFWETIDERTRMIVASHLSETRSLRDTIKVFREGLETANPHRPRHFFVDGSMQYERAFKKVFHHRDVTKEVRLIQRVGINSRQTNNLVERLHQTVKEKVRPMRGFKNQDSARLILAGYVANYNYARPHMFLKGQTPAQRAGIEVKGWKQLVENAIKQEVLQIPSQEERRVAIAPVQVV